MHDAQELGTTWSLKKHAAAMKAIVYPTVGIRAASISKIPAPAKPVHAMLWRIRCTPIHRPSRLLKNPQNNEPIPQNSSGKTA
jgi:hypothetical protein